MKSYRLHLRLLFWRRFSESVTSLPSGLRPPTLGVSLPMVITLVLGVAASSCRSTRSTQSATVDEAFAPFYDRFLTDSTFQMERTQFPLPGQKFTADVADSAYRWHRAEWRMLREPQLDSTYFTRNLSVTDTLVTDEIAGKDSGLYFRMDYRPVNKQWHLVRMVDRDL